MKKIIFSVIFILLGHNSFSSDNNISHLKNIGKTFTSMAKKTSPAVVFIQTEHMQVFGSHPWQFFSPFGEMEEFPFSEDRLKEFFRGTPQKRYPKKQTRKIIGQGSGFIISSDGYILTNNHVVGGTEKVMVKLLDGRNIEAKVIGSDEHSDIAIIKIKANNLPILPLGDSDKLEVGEWVVALGSPFGLSHSLTAGVISALGRSSVGITNYENFIQTDAAINPGNSGGPLLNLDGEAIGMNTAIFSRTGGYMGIGFAIPINMVKNIKNQLIKSGRVTRGYIGVVIQNLNVELAEQFDIKNLNGVLISDVEKSSPAAKAYLKPGDVIIKFKGENVIEAGVFRNMVALSTPGQRKSITVVRNGKQKTLGIKIGTLKDKLIVSKDTRYKESDFGLIVANPTLSTKRKYGFPSKESGVVVIKVEPSSIASIAGIRAGVLIKEVNRIKVNSVLEFRKALKKSKKKKSILLLILDGKYTKYVTFSIH